jgi:hypothetical protein
MGTTRLKAERGLRTSLIAAFICIPSPSPPLTLTHYLALSTRPTLCPARSISQNLSILSSPNCPSASCRAFLDLDSFSSDCFHFGTAFTAYCGTPLLTALTSHCLCFGTDLVSRADRSRSRAPVCRSRVHPKASAVSADDKFVENEEVAPRVTPVAAARRSRPCPRAHPLLRIGDPSPYAPSPALPSVDPTVLQVLRSYPLSCYKPKHGPGALVASDTSLAGAQTTPPKTLLSSPNHKKLQKPPICRTFTRIPSA